MRSWLRSRSPGRSAGSRRKWRHRAEIPPAHRRRMVTSKPLTLLSTLAIAPLLAALRRGRCRRRRRPVESGPADCGAALGSAVGARPGNGADADPRRAPRGWRALPPTRRSRASTSSSPRLRRRCTQASRRFVGVSTDAAGEDLVAAILPIAGFRIFPSIDLEQPDLDRDALGAVTEEAPADIVGWLHDWPFLDVSPIDEHVRVGRRGTRVHLRGRRPARRRTACGPAPEEPCAATFWAAGRSFMWQRAK